MDLTQKFGLIYCCHVLTQEDKKDIAQIVHTEVEGLAYMVAKGFEDVDKRFEQVDKRFDQVDGRLDSVEGRLDTVESTLSGVQRDVAYVRENFVTAQEHKDLKSRTKLIEQTLHIVSGA